MNSRANWPADPEQFPPRAVATWYDEIGRPTDAVDYGTKMGIIP